jgi:hypothetical protein
MKFFNQLLFALNAFGITLFVNGAADFISNTNNVLDGISVVLGCLFVLFALLGIYRVNDSKGKVVIQIILDLIAAIASTALQVNSTELMVQLLLVSYVLVIIVCAIIFLRD